MSQVQFPSSFARVGPLGVAAFLVVCFISLMHVFVGDEIRVGYFLIAPAVFAVTSVACRVGLAKSKGQ